MWAVNLVLYALHVGGSSRVGESWQSPESWVQLGGFVLLLAGTIVYAQVRQPACRPGCSVLALRGMLPAVTRRSAHAWPRRMPLHVWPLSGHSHKKRTHILHISRS